MNEKRNEAGAGPGEDTSGQGGQKLRQDSERARPSQRLREKPGRPRRRNPPAPP